MRKCRKSKNCFSVFCINVLGGLCLVTKGVNKKDKKCKRIFKGEICFRDELKIFKLFIKENKIFL